MPGLLDRLVGRLQARLEAKLGLPGQEEASDRKTPGRATGKPRAAAPTSAQSFLGFTDIRDGIIILPGNRYRAVIEVIGMVNFPLLSDTEQENIEASFRTLVASLNFPVQFYMQTRQVDLREQIARIQQAKQTLPEPLQESAKALEEYLAAWMKASPLVQKNFVVIEYDAKPGEGGFVVAKQELLHRVEIVGAELSKWLRWRRLTTDEIIELLYTITNKDKSKYARASDAVEHGFFAPYVTGEPKGVAME